MAINEQVLRLIITPSKYLIMLGTQFIIGVEELNNKEEDKVVIR